MTVEVTGGKINIVIIGVDEMFMGLKLLRLIHHQQKDFLPHPLR